MSRRALLFDLDGTLVDSQYEIALSLRVALQRCGIQLPLEEVIRLVDGSSLEAIWTSVAAEATPGATLERFAEAYRAHYARDLGHATGVFEGVERTLRTLRERLPEVPFAIVSNKRSCAIAPLLQRLGLEAHFEIALGGDGRVPARPDPALLHGACAQLSVEAAGCTMIGDTPVDVQAGRRAGMRTVAFSYGMASEQALRSSEPDHLLERFEQLLELAY